MFKTLKLKDLVIFFLLILVTVTIGYCYANSQARSQLWQKAYPIRAELSVRQITCSEDSPIWLTDILKHQTRNNNAPANQIAYIEPNGIAHHCENGYVGQYPLLSDATTVQTRFRYASVTKLWTADAILELIKEGKLSLDTPLTDIISEIDTPIDTRINDITIGQLLLHRAGFDRYSVFGQDMFGIGKDICPNHLAGLNDITLGFDPDSKTSYSNLGYCLLGEVISRLNQDRPYTDIITQRYQLNDTSLRFVPNSALADEVTYNYVETGLTGYADIYTAFDYEGLASAAGLSGNAIDLAKQVHVMAVKPAPNILSDSPKVACDTTQIAECYGYAMLMYQPTPQSKKVHYRDGSLLGLSTVVAVDERGSTVALLSNGTPDNGKVGNDNIKMMIYEQLIQ
ncbi:D-alanyl-D-alanine carboxypeptidase [Psychrobacter sp. SC65A.3]|uniref:serine hydrolase domain-containing protein n=1 Tax=Psychrobacter sp. SC65A.3 TaxID=2983299 RepID=UPI0021D88084|nr:serine hydrolase domain-containing protein [Psychrobacter sp. SC65A.3]WAI88797.1 D-alanyl-D-alanine carboxypeptidase [Psychrobacter sp. SC65A.3]